MPPLRLLAVNSRELHLDRDGLAALIARAEPHIVCVHGAPALLRWRSISAALARKAGLVVVGGGRTGGANLLLSTLGVDAIALPDVGFGPPSLREPGGAALAVINRDGRQVVFAGARLVGTPAQRREQVAGLDYVLGCALPGDPPAIVCLDGGVPGAPLGERQAAGETPVFVDRRVTVVSAAASQPGVAELTLDLSSVPVG